jgi:DNA-binding NtrC family response regulator
MKGDVLLSICRNHAIEDFIGDHPSFTKLVQKVRNVAEKHVYVLLIGETGTGKGRCAEFLHQYSHRCDGPFIPYNCGSGPENLFESQIFGHVKGAFTGAYNDRPGLVEEAHTGILFLDEINSLDRSAQVKLNQFLETGCFRRLGENQIRRADVRIISASNVDLHKEVLKGRFREDLYYRLAEYEICLPPLRSRREDIILLAKYFKEKHKHLSAVNPIFFSPKVLEDFLNYDWPGNIRELENFIKRCLIDASSSVINSVLLPQSDTAYLVPYSDRQLDSLPWKQAKKQVISSFERSYLQSLLKKYNGTVAQCARHAGIQSSDFWKLMRKYNIKAEIFR